MKHGYRDAAAKLFKTKTEPELPKPITAGLAAFYKMLGVQRAMRKTPLPAGHEWVTHDKVGGRAATRRLKQQAKMAGAVLDEWMKGGEDAGQHAGASGAERGAPVGTDGDQPIHPARGDAEQLGV